MNDFELTEPLGRGQFGKVFLATETRSGYPVALKILSKTEIMQHKVEKQVLREIEIHSYLNHPHIIQLFTYFHNEKQIYMVLEYAAGGAVFSLLQKQPNKRFDEHISAKFIHQVADALNYCHKNNVIHRDVKPENLLLTIDGNIKLADFGWSVHISTSKRKTICGTIDYLAPEIVTRKKYDITVDLWCLGILCYEFLVGVPPFRAKTEDETYKKINKSIIPWKSVIKSGAKDLISKLLQKKSSERISLDNVMTHSWILENKDKLKK